jgi:hypothetical protein
VELTQITESNLHISIRMVTISTILGHYEYFQYSYCKHIGLRRLINSKIIILLVVDH